jgi:hypothetical protein
MAAIASAKTVEGDRPAIEALVADGDLTAGCVAVAGGRDVPLPALVHPVSATSVISAARSVRHRRGCVTGIPELWEFSVIWTDQAVNRPAF